MSLKKLMNQVRDRDLCVSCGGCVELCPYHKAYRGKITTLFDCDIEQGQCHAYCPRTETDVEVLSQTLFKRAFEPTPLGIHREIMIARAGSRCAHDGFQNGGAVSALSACALDNGFVGSMVLTTVREGYPTPVLVETSRDVFSCAATKYMATPTVSKLNQSVRKGVKNIGVVGTGCQMLSVAKMRTNPLEKEELENAIGLSIGLFCTWALDTRRFAEYLSQKLAIESIISMDVPPPPAEVLIVRTESDEYGFPLDEIRPLVPKGCRTCPDMTAEWADVSIGAYEGNPEWNTVIIRSEKGESLVRLAVENGYLVTGEFPQDSLNHLSLGAENKKKRAMETEN